jgi:hypothetical protein
MTTSGVSKKLMLNVQMVCLALIVISSPVYANLIRNGDFATGDFTAWTLFTTAHGSRGVGLYQDLPCSTSLAPVPPSPRNSKSGR